jgi:DNA-binding FadR family transcriptional regulator
MISLDEDTISDEKEKKFIFNTYDLAFHEFFWKKSESFRRADILQNQYFQLLAAMNKDASTLGSAEEKYEEHQKIVEACRSGSLNQALSAFQKHMDSYLNAVKML